MSQKNNNHKMSKNTALEVERNDFANVQLADIRRIRTLGTGAFGRVELVQLGGDSSRTFALKQITKASVVKEHSRRQLLSEKEVMMEADSPFIVKLLRTFKNERYLYMLMESCLGGDLLGLMSRRKHISKKDTCFYIACVLGGFEYLHSRDIVYRDLKLENLLLDRRGYLKLCDFGFAKRIASGTTTHTFCGTSYYLAPEVINRTGHDISVDYWSLGVLMFELLNRRPPFDGDDNDDVIRSIKRGTDFVKYPRNMGKKSVDLFKKLCKVNPVERLGFSGGGIEDIRKHEWFNGFNFEALVAGTLAAPFVPTIKNERDTRNFQTCKPEYGGPPPDDFSDWDATF